ncbi:MAG TPA: hypothetical protein VMY37_08120 [Thermoguttaceae bacterium]|nr:hypothetical protein [Thermoguttaceae bacterium]
MTHPTNRRQFLRTSSLAGAGLLARGLEAATSRASSPRGERVFRAGAHAIDVSPPKLPVIVNGYTFERLVDVVHDPLHARCLVLDDGTTRIAIAVVDICVMPRELIDRAKRLACEATGIPTDRMLISATHTHSAPSVMPALGSRAGRPGAAIRRRAQRRFRQLRRQDRRGDPLRPGAHPRRGRPALWIG